jgi:hypothetical protein
VEKLQDINNPPPPTPPTHFSLSHTSHFSVRVIFFPELCSALLNMEGKLRLLQSFLALKTLSLKISCRGRENLNLNTSIPPFFTVEKNHLKAIELVLVVKIMRIFLIKIKSTFQIY